MRKYAVTLTMLVGFLIGIHETSSAQQRYIISQYMFNGFILNPAYAGTHESWSLTAMTRYQWTGISGAPVTNTFTAHGPLDRQGSASIGFLAAQDKFGAISINNYIGAFAYRIPLDNGKRRLSIGLQGGVSTLQIDFSNQDRSDPVFGENIDNQLSPNIGGGVFYHGEKLYAGFSVPYLIARQLGSSSQDVGFDQVNYYFTLGSILQVTPSIKLKPSILVRYFTGSSFVDLNASLLFNEVIWVGIVYRVNNALAGVLELQLTDNLRFGYSYDFPTSEINTVSSGSHEVVVNYRFKKKNKKTLNPRYF